MEFDGSMVKVVNNKAQSRFEVKVGPAIAKIEYRLRENIIYFLHTEVPKWMEGQGVASKMAKVALNYALDQKLGVKPWCPFVAAYIKRHMEYQVLVV